MRSNFSAALVNDPFGDPGLLVDFHYRPRALLFDLGDLTPLPPKKILRTTDVFVTHTHMDHFYGFDRLLRVCVGRQASIRLYGPTGFVDQVRHKMAAYTWNIVDRYPGEAVLDVWEVDAAWHAEGMRWRGRDSFRPTPLPARTCTDGVLLDEPALRVRAAWLDHGIPCLAFALEETCHVNVWKNRLADLGLPAGPWVRAVKDAVTAGAPDDTPVHAWWHDAQGDHSRTLSLGTLRASAISVTPGEKIAYVTDVGLTDDNRRRIVELARGATRLFVEATFLHEDVTLAAARGHLTARQAGELARACGAVVVTPFHFSPRYEGRGEELQAEVAAAHAGA